MHDGSKSVNDNEHSRTGETFSDGSSDLGIHPTRSYVSFTRMAAESGDPLEIDGGGC